MRMDAVTLVPGNSLITATPEEGRQLAVKMARLVVKNTQQDAGARYRLREVYANDAGMLLQLTQVVATEFATIAAANMASDAGFVQFVAELIDLGDELTCKRLSGEWGLWLHGKIVALICDDQLLLKPTEAGRALLGGNPTGVPPYPEAKPWLLV